MPNIITKIFSLLFQSVHKFLNLNFKKTRLRCDQNLKISYQWNGKIHSIQFFIKYNIRPLIETNKKKWKQFKIYSKNLY